MTREQLEMMLPEFNNPAVVKALEAYASFRIDLLQKKLESARDIIDVRQAQGAITELRRLFTVKDEVNQRAKEMR